MNFPCLTSARAAGLALVGLASLSPVHADETDVGFEPWSEAIVSVSDLEASAAWLVWDGGWVVDERGEMDRSELDYWRLGEEVTAQFLRICAPDTQTGCIRYVQFDNVEQRPIRLAARPWDTGGIFSLMVRSEDTRALFDAAIARGWWAESEPYNFAFGSSDLVNVVVRGPHGVNYAVYQRRSPAFTAFPVGKLSQSFNSMRMVKDQPASLAFYRDVIGLSVLFDAPYLDDEPVHNNFSVPSNLSTKIVRRAAVVQPEVPMETGRIELMQFEGFDGRDFSAHAAPPNLGIISVRYPVTGLDALRSRLSRRETLLAYEAEGVEISGLGTVDLIAVLDPDGNITEFYSAPADD